jgi:hypothetical protein
MSAFSGLIKDISISTPYGSLTGGKITVGGAAPELPQPTPLTPAGPGSSGTAGGALAWLKSHPLALVGIIVGGIALILAIRR